MFCETRELAEEWTYRWLAAAHTWANDEHAALTRIGATADLDGTTEARPQPLAPTTAEIRAWARATGLTVPDRGRLRPKIHQAWRDAHPQHG